MSYNGSGTFNINSAGQPVVTGTVITSTAFNALTSDLANGLTTALTKDGQTTPTANIPMGNFKITGLAAGTAVADAVRLSQLQNGSTTSYITVTGTDTITGTVTPTLTAYATGQQFSFVVAATNTAAVTLNVDGIGAKAVTRTGSVALVAGDMVTGQVVIVEYDGTRFQLLNGNSFTNLKASGTLSVTGVATLGNGAILGTPASGTVTNLTGTASININGTVGATTAATGAFTTLSATGNISTTGSSSILQVLAGASVQIQNTAASANWNFSTSGTGLTLNSPQLGTFSISNPVAITGTISTTGVATFAAGTVALPSITTSGDTNTGVYFPAADTVGITAGGVENLRIGGEGILVTRNVNGVAYSKVLNTTSGTAAYAAFNASNGTYVLESGVLSATYTTAGVYVANSAFIQSTNNLAIVAAGTIFINPNGSSAASTVATITSTGLAVTGALSATTTGKVGTTLGVGAATPSASGSGITFPATESASTDVNTLDDYEEGTWTPAVTSITGTITTVGAVAGTYTKIGRSVTVSADVTITTNGTGATGIYIAGLPFIGNQTTVTFYAMNGFDRNGLALAGEYNPGGGGGNGRINFYKYDGTYPGADGKRFIISSTYNV
jgi:hypothetical protein